MTQIEQIKRRIFSPITRGEFDDIALTIFRVQYQNVAPYRRYCDLIDKTPEQVNNINQIPFLPIEIFKTHKLLHKEIEFDTKFFSSGTTGSTPSIHYIPDLQFYERCFTQGFTKIYGPLDQYVILALLPSYLERKGSSLVYMADRLIQKSDQANGGFYLDQLKELRNLMHQLADAGKRIVLLGVSYALLDLAEMGPWNLPSNTIIMETGGMKGTRTELTKKALHEILSSQFGLDNVHSEYGMTELMSQAYATSKGNFKTPPWMRVMIRDPEDPMSLLSQGSGGINIIDLANIYSCAFIATQDLGTINQDGSFSLLGRFDHSDIRGCNLLLES